jgi:hypothetical protein
MGQARYSAADILGQLDEHARAFTFPVLDNFYVALADVRLTGYRDDRRWAQVIEVLGLNTSTGLPEGLENTFYTYGNCLLRPAGIGPFHQAVIANDPERPAFSQDEDDRDWYCVREDAEVVLIRGRRVHIPRDRGVYGDRGILLDEGEPIYAETLLRVLAPEYRDLLFATEQELRACVPADLPAILRLHGWYHPEDFDEQPPSDCITFQKIAEVLATGDPNRYSVDEDNNNTHWSHWPAGGSG